MTRGLDGSVELLRVDIPSEQGNERIAMARVAEVVEHSGLTADQIERLKTAVAEATMNGIEHGNGGRPDVPVEVIVFRDDEALVVTVTDLGGAREHLGQPEAPDLDAKLAGLQRTRGWGLFLIEHMVDEVADTTDGDRHTVRLVMRHQAGAGAAGEPANTGAKGGGPDGTRR